MIENDLVPKHQILNSDEAKKILEKYKARPEQLPKIFSSDPALVELKPQVGDLVKISRNNPVIGRSYYYRIVIKG